MRGSLNGRVHSAAYLLSSELKLNSRCSKNSQNQGMMDGAAGVSRETNDHPVNQFS